MSAEELSVYLRPLPPGAVILRDVRCPHSGTMNLCGEPRILPGCVCIDHTFMHDTTYRPAVRAMPFSLDAHLQYARGHNDYMYDPASGC